MIKLLAELIYALLFDENAARRWLRGSVGVLAVSGAAYADQISAVLPAHVSGKVAHAIRGVSVLCAFGVAAHDARKQKLGKVLELPKP